MMKQTICSEKGIKQIRQDVIEIVSDVGKLGTPNEDVVSDQFVLARYKAIFALTCPTTSLVASSESANLSRKMFVGKS